MEFFRFPRTPHLIWLGSSEPRGDKVLSPEEARELLSHSVIVEEKLDGANLGFSVGPDGDLRVQNRGAYVSWDSLHPQFKPLRQWLSNRRAAIVEALGADLMLFGEWCYARHSIHYTQLPDWFIAFDVYDRRGDAFWGSDRRNALLRDLSVAAAPELARGTFGLAEIRRLLGSSRFADAPAEGLYVRWDLDGLLKRRAKLVRPEFTQAIEVHWSSGRLRRNELAATSSPPPDASR